MASLKDTLRESRLDLVLGAFREMDYRFCRRVLLMSEDRLEMELRGLTREWCSQRKSMADYMLSKQKGTGGLVSEMLIFAIDSEELTVRQDYIRQILEAVELPYVLEDYNRKSCWWGSLPGMFRAGGKIWPRKVSSWARFPLPELKGGTECINLIYLRRRAVLALVYPLALAGGAASFPI